MRHRHLGLRSILVVLAALVIAVHPRNASATVDLTGGWFVKYDPAAFAFGPDHWDIVQSGSQLTVTFGSSAYTGTIDDMTGDFDVDLGPSSVPFCSNNRLLGTAALDSKTFSGNAFFAGTPHCGGVTVSVTGSRCGNGVLDPGENCDDGNRFSGDCCSSTCAYEGSGSPCTSDGNACTDDTCDGAGTCQYSNNTGPCTVSNGCVGGTCGGGTCTPNGPLPAGTACDSDASVCTLESCDGAGTCNPAGTVDCAPCGTCDAQRGCVGYPGCYGPEGSVTLKTGPVATDKRAQWGWNGPIPLAAFGSPTSTTNYTLCVYEDSTTEVPGVILRATAPAGGTCGINACWEQKTNGFAYKDRELTPDGLVSITLKAASTPDGKSRIRVKGKGANLGLPATLPTGTPIFAELRATDGVSDVCWGAYFTTPTKSTPFIFKARTP